jgi:hypothetical protein
MRRLSPGGTFAVWLAAAAIILGGCGKSSDVTGLGAAAQQTADDLAVQVGASASADNGGLMTEIEGTTSAVPMALQPSSIDGVAAADTTFTRGPFTITLERTFYDVDGNALQQWDASAVRVQIGSWVRGSVTGVRYQATLGRTGTLDVSGLAAAVDTLVFAGTATDTTDARYTSLDGLRTVDVHVLATRVLAGVRALKNRNVNPWPLSGTATWNLSVDKFASGPRGGIEVHYEAVAVVEFDGTQYADVTVNGRYRYRMDLLTGGVSRS